MFRQLELLTPGRSQAEAGLLQTTPVQEVLVTYSTWPLARLGDSPGGIAWDTENLDADYQILSGDTPQRTHQLQLLLST